jgi:hypothetical protein
LKIGRFHFNFLEKSPNLGNGRGKTKVRTEAVPFPKPKHGKISFSVLEMKYGWVEQE